MGHGGRHAGHTSAINSSDTRADEAGARQKLQSADQARC
jgi:hypothetical protein